VLQIRIHKDPCHFQGSGSVSFLMIWDPGSVPGYLESGSGSISYSNEYNKINLKGKFTEVFLLVGSFRHTDKERRCIIITVLGTIHYGTSLKRKGSGSNWKGGSRSVSIRYGSARLVFNIFVKNVPFIFNLSFCWTHQIKKKFC
jgi:hypothetical protein